DLQVRQRRLVAYGMNWSHNVHTSWLSCVPPVVRPHRGSTGGICCTVLHALPHDGSHRHGESPLFRVAPSVQHRQSPSFQNLRSGACATTPTTHLADSTVIGSSRIVSDCICGFPRETGVARAPAQVSQRTGAWGC